MTDKLPFTIEILEFEAASPVVLDRVIGGSIYFEEESASVNICLALLIKEHGLVVIASSAMTMKWSISGGPMKDSDEAPPQSDPMLMQDLETMSAKLLEIARNLPPGSERHSAPLRKSGNSVYRSPR
jgi:hypothetical protein